MEQIFEVTQNLIYITVFIALGLNLYIVKKFKGGILNVLFASFGFSIFFTGLGMLFAYLQDIGFYQLEDVTFHVWWHLIVYLALSCLVWGGYRMKKIVDTGSSVGFGQKDMLVYGLIFILIAVIFLIAPIANEPLSKILVGSVVDKLGLHHFGVVILAIISAWYLFYVKGHWGILGTSISFMIGFLLLISGQHFWETITESWKIIQLENTFIEGIELLFIYPAVSLFCIGEWKIVQFIRKGASGA